MFVRKYRYALLAGSLVFLPCFFYLFTHYRSYFPPCLFHELTGLHCPGCGATRAVLALLHLDLVRAVHMNALFVLFALPALFVLGLEMLQERLIFSAGAHKAVGYAYLALAIAFTVARNIPGYPFELLAPI